MDDQLKNFVFTENLGVRHYSHSDNAREMREMLHNALFTRADGLSASVNNA